MYVCMYVCMCVCACVCMCVCVCGFGMLLFRCALALYVYSQK